MRVAERGGDAVKTLMAYRNPATSSLLASLVACPVVYPSPIPSPAPSPIPLPHSAQGCCSFLPISLLKPPLLFPYPNSATHNPHQTYWSMLLISSSFLRLSLLSCLILFVHLAISSFFFSMPPFVFISLSAMMVSFRVRLCTGELDDRRSEAMTCPVQQLLLRFSANR